MKEYVLRPFTNAMGPEREKSRFTYLNFYGQKVNVPYIVWYLEGADKHILIDSGCSSKDYVEVIKGGMEEGFVAGGETFKDVLDVTPLEEGLKGFGITPEDVEVIILTHLHWDHIMGTRKCKRAKVIVQEEEWKAAYTHHALMEFAYAPRWFYEGMRNLEFVKGDGELFPGVEVIFSPGHTPGGQSVVVNTKKGKFAITGFCGVYDNLYPPEEVKKAIGYPVIPAAVHTDATVAYESALKLVQMFGERVLPAHEQALMKVKRIPE